MTDNDNASDQNQNDGNNTRSPCNQSSLKNVAQQVLKILTSISRNRIVRFARTHKVTAEFRGVCYGAVWSGPTKRRGGGFEFVVDYRKLKKVSHRTVLKKMSEDYRSLIAKLADDNASPLRKRRMPYKRCHNTAVNTSIDLEFFIGGVWRTLTDIIPTAVRELEPGATLEWLAAHHRPLADVSDVVTARNILGISDAMELMSYDPFWACYRATNVEDVNSDLRDNDKGWKKVFEEAQMGMSQALESYAPHDSCDAARDIGRFAMEAQLGWMTSGYPST